MEPLDAIEIQELMEALNRGMYPIPIGSIWSNPDASQLFLVLHHANIPAMDGPQSCLVVQNLSDGTAWVQLTEDFLENGWHNVGFVWDRSVNV